MKKIRYIIGLVSYFVAVSASAQVPNARIALNVVDPNNAPVVGVRVGVGGGLNTPDAEYPRKANGETDTKGSFSATISSSRGLVSAYAEEAGYYSTEVSGIPLYKNGNEVFEAQKKGRWQPWERSITLVLKPIKNPVPMYVKRIEAFIPELGKPAGYDLEKGDWVAPYGKGAKTDFVFTAEGRLDSAQSYSGILKLDIPGEGNGIQSYDLDPVQRSELKLPYEAPETGYQASWVWHNSRKTPIVGQPSVFVDESNDLRAFIYRVRTVLDSQGRVIRANYGKIHGPIYFSPRLNGKWVIGITYYYNPDETRNLECDPKRNLFPKQQEGIEP